MEFKVNVDDDLKFNFGQKLYGFRKSNTKRFLEPCPICDGTKKIVYRGVELNCPYCAENYDRNCCYVNKWTIVEFIIYKAEIYGEPVKNNYFGKTEKLPRIRFKAFTRQSTAFSDFRDVFVLEPRVDVDVSKAIENPWSDYLFTEKRKAMDVVDMLNAKEVEILEEFNLDHGTEHKYHFE